MPGTANFIGEFLVGTPCANMAMLLLSTGEIVFAAGCVLRMLHSVILDRTSQHSALLPD